MRGLLVRSAAATAEIRFGERLVVYALNRRRRRSIGFVVGPDGLTVNAPGWLGHGEIEAALQAKARWIVAKLDEQQRRAERHDAARIDWRDGCTLPYLGVVLTLRLGGAGRAAVLASSETAAPVLTLPLPVDAPADRIEATARRWLQAEARRVFVERCAHHAACLGVQPAALRLTSARTRWGSASADRTIRLNWRLIHLAPAAIDYVVVHELAHLREMNHGPRFWAIVAAALPGYEAVRRELRAVQLPAFD